MTENTDKKERPASAPEDGAIPDVPSAARSPFMLAMQFFLIPLGIVVACVAVFLLFGLLAVEKKGTDDYLKEITGGDFNRRWQAAYELSKRISQDEGLREDKEFVKRLVGIFDGAKADPDPRVRGYLALALGQLKASEAVPALSEALGDANTDTAFYSAWSLGAIGDEAAVDPLMAHAGHPDKGVRTMVAYSLGVLGSARSADLLVGMLGDEAPEVRWNSAAALARLGDARGKDVLMKLLEPGALDSFPDMTDIQKRDARVAAVTGLANLGGEDVHALLENLRLNDPDVAVQQACAAALKNP
jgi:HEAT repeat protein